jgi:hypothetical protein
VVDGALIWVFLACSTATPVATPAIFRTSVFDLTFTTPAGWEIAQRKRKPTQRKGGALVFQATGTRVGIDSAAGIRLFAEPMTLEQLTSGTGFDLRDGVWYSEDSENVEQLRGEGWTGGLACRGPQATQRQRHCEALISGSGWGMSASFPESAVTAFRELVRDLKFEAVK